MQKSLKMMTIQDVSERLHIPKYTLRFWEKELDGLLVPFRTKGGQRRYTLEHVFVLNEIKRLKNEGCSLADIREKLNSPDNSTSENPNHQTIDHLANRIAEIVKSTIYSFFEETQ